jgi:transcriptional regulator GlxA family with amidase domain
MLDFLHQHYAEPLELQQIAAAANISERECLRCFQKTIRMAPIQYLLKYRVSVSARLLADTDAPITEICNQIGFDSPSYFSKIFKRFICFTPTAYRKRQRIC